MNVVFLTTKPPTLTSGAEVRNFYLLHALLESPTVKNVSLIYIPPFSGNANFKYPSKSKKLSTHIFPLPTRSLFKSILGYISGKIPYIEYLKTHQYYADIQRLFSGADLVLLSELDSYFVIEKLLQKSSNLPKMILDCHNVDYIRFDSEIRSSNFLRRTLGATLSKKLKKYEINALKKVDHVLCCSKLDKDYFSKFVNEKKIAVVPNGVKISNKSEVTTGKQSIVFWDCFPMLQMKMLCSITSKVFTFLLRDK